MACGCSVAGEPRATHRNPYVLATQIGSCLHDWKVPPPEVKSYATAPEVRKPSTGESLFRTRCAACHTLDEAHADVEHQAGVGPDPLGVTQKRDRDWLTRWLADPDKMLAERDPIVMELYARYDNVPMQNLRLTEVDVRALLDYLESAGRSMETPSVTGPVVSRRAI